MRLNSPKINAFAIALKICCLALLILLSDRVNAQDNSSGSSQPVEQIYNEQHRLNVGDLIDVRVLQEDELNSKTRVDPDGTVTLPLLGTIRVGGKSVLEARNVIKAALQKDYLYNPQVQLTVVEYAKRRFAVLGEVSRPGYFEMPQTGKVTLLEAIAMAGGYTAIADNRKVSVKRVVNGKEAVIPLNARAMAKESGAKIFELQPDDTVTVGQSIF